MAKMSLKTISYGLGIGLVGRLINSDNNRKVAFPSGDGKPYGYIILLSGCQYRIGKLFILTSFFSSIN